MRTVQMTLDESLVDRLDKVVKKLGTSRSAFTRTALRAALRQLREEKLERRHRAGYSRKPVRRGEFDVWQREQAWPD
ncbi:MAG: ribbon-helix-helix protein, CopG family [Planctomycetes bacterium]|nr:ribbon-helix-helix protein, CopG family [Planctomycetota bacterium]